MSPDERVYFEQLRKSNPDVDQAVVEHTFFLQQMNRFDDTRKFKSLLTDTHLHLAEKELIRSGRPQGRARVVYLYNRYKRVALIAASIAGITVLTMSALIWSFSPGKPVKRQDLMELNRNIQSIDQKVNQIQRKNAELDQKISSVQDIPALPPIEYKSGGTGFLIDTKGYLVTNAHVVKDARHIAIQKTGGPDLKVKVVYTDLQRDIAILKIEDRQYKPAGPVPYSIRRASSDLAEPIFMLGYPRNDIVYGDGYIAAKTGHNGDTLTCQIAIPANRGNSGSPILNHNGEVIGILSKKENLSEGAAFAIQSKFILSALAQLQKDTTYQGVKAPAASLLRGADRKDQVRKIADYVYIVKVD